MTNRTKRDLRVSVTASRNCRAISLHLKKLGIAMVVFVALFIALPMTVQAYSHIVRVGLTRAFANRESIPIANTSLFIVMDVEVGFIVIDELHSSSGFTVRASGSTVQLLSGNAVIHSFPTGYPAQVMGTDGDPVRISGYSYRGIMEFIPSSGRVSAVNVLSIEEYLFGVLPSEMSPGFHMEALKAQAVAARTYTFNRIRRAESHRNQPFDMCDTACCQVYRGMDREHYRTNEAVMLTYGLMLFYNGQPIIAQYFSSSGGATENSEDVWGTMRPYARAVNEINEPNPRIWTRTFTWAQLTQAANAAGARIGNVTGISITGLSAGGRATELTLHGTGGTGGTTWRTPNARTFFAPIGGALYSRMYTITGGGHTTPAVAVVSADGYITAPLNSLQGLDRNGAISTIHHGYIYDGDTTRRVNATPIVVTGGSGITIHGRGWGHGVGMSQLGALGMANIGYTFIEILMHYYTGVELRWYQP